MHSPHNRRKLNEILRTGGGLNLADSFDLRGSLRITKNYADGTNENVVDDKNLIVTLGRRVMSRLMTGPATGATILTGTAPALYIVRSTNGSPTDAYVSVETDGAETVVEGWKEGAGSADWSFRFVAGAKTVTQLVADINATVHWRAEVIGSAGTLDAVQLLRITEGYCLGNAASYTGIVSNVQYARTLFIVQTAETSVTTTPPLTVSCMRLGMEGHDTVTTTIGQDAEASDERMRAGLRASDYGHGALADDFLELDDVTFLSSGVAEFTCTLDTTMANGYNLSECGLFTPDYMIAKKNFGIIAKTSAFGLTLQWSIYM